MASEGFAWCPDCKCWVPSEEMNYDHTEEEPPRLIRVCNFCLGVKELPFNTTLRRVGFVHDPHHEQTQCLYCDSWNTTELQPDWNKFKCNDCGETFRRYLE